MNREIKFRAFVEKNVIEGWPAQMHPVENISWRDGKMLAVNLLPCEWIDIKWVTTLMQYTGLKDKNGKEIYEGDILKREWLINWLVKWHDGGFVVENITGVYQSKHFPLTQPDCYDREVIGNVWENPELLEVT